MARLDAGHALREIRDQQLYRGRFANFEAYVVGTFSFDLRRAQQLMRAAEIADSLANEGIEDLPSNEAQTRPLSALPPEEQAEVWKQALDEHGSSKNVSKAKVERVVQTHRGGESAIVTEGNDASDSDAGWPTEARQALKLIDRRYRSRIVRIVNQFGQDPCADLVRDAIDGFAAAVLENGDDVGASVVGVAAELIDDSDTSPDQCETGSVSSPITELALLSADEAERHPPKQHKHTSFIGTPEKGPLLVALPTVVAPASLTRNLPPKISTVIAEIGELERLGGPVSKGVLDIEEVRAACREVSVQKYLQRTNENVDWARYTTNPVTGCWHACRTIFCYAAGIAARLFAQGFLPTLYPARLDHFRNTALPDVAEMVRDEAWRERSVFCVSMGDLFGKWIPSWYIEAVLAEVRVHPEWFVFFLSKHPKRLAEFDFPPNCAVGITLTGDEPQGARPYSGGEQMRYYEKLASQLGAASGALYKWISLEPFRGRVEDLSPFFDAGVEMVAIGGQSQTMFAPAMQPELTWVDHVRRQVRAAGVSLFEKENLIVRPKEIPFPQGLPPMRPR